ncbi:MAG: TolB family protein [Chloroflexia bacterium]
MLVRQRLLLVLGILLSLTSCALWESEKPTVGAPPPTPTPPEVEEAGKHSPSLEGRLLYARGGNIWLRQGTTAERLTDCGSCTQPAWSPDGRQIAFVVREESYSDIWVMDADGKNARPVTRNRSPAAERTLEYVLSSYWAYQPQWVPPDGEWLVYISHPTPHSSVSEMAVYQIRPDGSNEHRVLVLDGNIESPSWSPDGSLLAFVYIPYATGPQLRYFDPESGRVRPLGPDLEGIERYDPAWSPNGQWIAYAARQGGSTDLWLMPSPLNPVYAGDWSPVRLTEQGRARGPAWSPTGDQIVYIAEEDGSFDLWLLDLESAAGGFPRPAQVQKLTAGAQVDATARPSWAP